MSASTRRVTVADELQGALIELIDLSLLVKQLSWVVTGPQAALLRGQLEDLVVRLHGHADDVAARMLECGYVPNGQSRAVAIESDLAPVPTRLLTGAQARDALRSRLGDVTARLRRSGEATAGDATAAELLAGVGAELTRYEEGLRSATGAA